MMRRICVSTPSPSRLVPLVSPLPSPSPSPSFLPDQFSSISLRRSRYTWPSEQGLINAGTIAPKQLDTSYLFVGKTIRASSSFILPFLSSSSSHLSSHHRCTTSFLLPPSTDSAIVLPSHAAVVPAGSVTLVPSRIPSLIISRLHVKRRRAGLAAATASTFSGSFHFGIASAAR